MTPGQRQQTEEITVDAKKNLIALSVALCLGTFGAASVAQAKAHNHSANGSESYAYDREDGDQRLWQVFPQNRDRSSAYEGEQAPEWSPFIGPR
jgi:hypothetical protein